MLRKELDTFLTVADAGSFLKASKVLYTTPASVMNQINKLEALVGVSLVERTNQGIRLTAAGRYFRESIQKLRQTSDAILARTRELAETEKRLIRVGTSILRPCRPLIRLSEELPYTIRILPFDDSPEALSAIMRNFGGDVDCIFSPCNSSSWAKQYNILVTAEVPCRVAVPRQHRLATKTSLTWPDLDGSTFMLVKRGASPVFDALRDELEQHPGIRVVDMPDFYDTSVFNICVERNYLMETLDIWKHIHPNILTLPMEWNYVMPLGIIYAKEPSRPVREFIADIQSLLERGGGTTMPQSPLLPR